MAHILGGDIEHVVWFGIVACIMGGYTGYMVWLAMGIWGACSISGDRLCSMAGDRGL